MRDEIVDRLVRNRNKVTFDEVIREADEDEEESGADDEFLELNSDDNEDTIEDDSTAPEQGSYDDEDIGVEDEGDEGVVRDEPDSPSSSGGHSAPRSFGDEGDSEEEDPTVEEEEDAPEVSPDAPKYENPLDNQYAANYTLGDDIFLSYLNSSNSEKLSGVIDGYDPEGFYRVKWSDGSTTNGLTDIALESLISKVKPTNEGACICGSKEFVEESNHLICDNCGRRIRESKEDPLMLADKSRPKGKRMIRSEAHPMSTATKPSIAENKSIKDCIREALKSKSIRESGEEEDESSVFDKLKSSLDNEFWTRKNELVEDIEELGYHVDEANAEYVVVSSDEDEDNALLVPIGGTSRTMTLDFSRSRLI